MINDNIEGRMRMECLFGRGKSGTDFTSEREMYVNNCGYFRGLEKDVNISRPRGRADYHLLFNASGEVLVNGERLSEGEAYIIFPFERQEYTYLCRENSLYYWLHFSGTRVSEILSCHKDSSHSFL